MRRGGLLTRIVPRRFEERKRVVDKARTAAANLATKDHFLNKEPLEGSTP